MLTESHLDLRELLSWGLLLRLRSALFRYICHLLLALQQLPLVLCNARWERSCNSTTWCNALDYKPLVLQLLQNVATSSSCENVHDLPDTERSAIFLELRTKWNVTVHVLGTRSFLSYLKAEKRASQSNDDLLHLFFGTMSCAGSTVDCSRTARLLSKPVS